MVSLAFSKNDIPDTDISKKEVKLMYNDNLRRFVRIAGSEENAIDRLIALCLPDTFYNTNRSLIWTIISPEKIIEMDHYVSRKLQAFYWIIKIYNSDYRSNKKSHCFFLDDSGEDIWDYENSDVSAKAYYYQAVLDSPTDPKPYYNKLGYIKTYNDSYGNLENVFNVWYNEMKTKGLEYMRRNNIPPIDSSKYRIEYYPRH